MNFTKAKSSIEKVSIEFQIKEPFYGSIFRRLRKIYSNEIDSIGLGFNGRNFDLWVNPDFINKLPYNEIKAICEHVLLHICFKHVLKINEKEISKRPIYHISAELEVNQRVKNMPSKAIGLEDIFGDNVENIEKNRKAEYYFSRFPKEYDINEANTLDSHVFWTADSMYKENELLKEIMEADEFSKELQGDEYNEDSVQFEMPFEENGSSNNDEKMTVEDLLRKAEEDSEGELPGSLPADYIRKVFVKEDEINISKDWYKILRVFLNQLLYKSSFSHYELKRSLRRPNKKLGFPFPSIKVNPLPILSIAVCIDGSGSIDNRTFDEFMHEINSLFDREINITLVGFDFEVKEQNIIKNYNPFQWQKAKRLDNLFPGELGGGTDFVPAVEAASKLNPKPDCILMFTDSYDKGNLEEPVIPMIFVLSQKNDNFYGWARCVYMFE